MHVLTVTRREQMLPDGLLIRKCRALNLKYQLLFIINDTHRSRPAQLLTPRLTMLPARNGTDSKSMEIQRNITVKSVRHQMGYSHLVCAGDVHSDGLLSRRAL